MAVYKSQFKGSQIDNAVSVANANLNKGSNDTPIYYDSEGLAQPIEKDTVPTVSSVKPLTSGGAYTGLEAVVDYSDIQYENFNGEFTKVGNVSIVDGIASGFSSTSYIKVPKEILNSVGTKSWSIEVEGVMNAPTAATGQPLFCGTNHTYNDTASFFNIGHLNNQETWIIYLTLNVSGTKTAQSLGASQIFNRTGQSYKYTLSYDSGLRKYSSLLKFADGTEFPLTLDSDYYLAQQTNDLYLGYNYGNYSINLNTLKIYVDNKLVYTSYPNPTLPPSQYAAKQYIDSTAATKQDTMYGGYGVDINGATVSVSNDVIREGEDLHTDLKVDHFGDVALRNDLEMLKVMNEMKHSTFVGVNGSGESDPKKFTVVGSPVIMDDGIASGFSSTSYLTAPNVVIDTTKPFKCCLELTTGTISGQGVVSFDSNWYASFTATKYFSWRPTSNQNNWMLTNETFEANTKYYIEFGYDGTDIFINYQKEGGNLVTKSVTPVNYVGVTNLNISSIGCLSTLVFNGSIDLKQFSITVDGIEVFSGNKTGIDTIKPDDYTLLTTLNAYVYNGNTIYADSTSHPSRLFNSDGSSYTGSDWAISGTSVQYSGNDATYTSTSNITLTTACDASAEISSDGVMKNAPNNGIKFDFDNTSSDFRFEYNYTNPNLVPQSWILGGAISVSPFYIFTANWGWAISIRDSGGNAIITQNFNRTNYPTLVLPQANKEYKFFFERKNGTYTVGVYDGTNWYTYSAQSNENVGQSFINTRQLLFDATSDNLVSVDLNKIKISYNDNVSYQPCLKIPYTLAKDGKKIVDSYYRSRVEDEYNQAGYTPYYTLNAESRGNYTPKASTVDGTLPAISDDGILTVATSGGRAISMTLPSDIESASSFKLEFDFETPSNITSTSTSMNAAVSTNYGGLSTNTIEYYINYWGVGCYLGGVTVVSNLYQGQFQNNKKYTVTLDYTNGNASCTLTPKDGTPVSSNPKAVTLSNLNGATLFFGSQAPSSEYKIDLNTIKLFVNNKLTYQAVIPPNYTMATVEEDDIVDEYLSGSTAYTQRANNVLEIQGTCTANTAVTFPNSKAFIDTNYALSIPYVSGTKTKTGFTAAEDGDYLAEGNVSI